MSAIDQVDAVLEFVYFSSQKFGSSVSTEVARVRRGTRQMNRVDPAFHLRLRVSLHTAIRQVTALEDNNRNTSSDLNFRMLGRQKLRRSTTTIIIGFIQQL